MTFPDFIRSLGIIPPESIEPGKFIACATDLNPRKKGGRIKLSEDGKVGWAWNYKQGEKAEWREDGEQPEIDRSKANAELSARLLKRREAERAGSLRARREYAAAMPLRGVST